MLIYHIVSCFGGRKSADGSVLQIRGLFSENDIFYYRARRRSRYGGTAGTSLFMEVLKYGAMAQLNSLVGILIILHVRVSQPSLVAPPLFTERRSSLIKNEHGVAAAAVCRRKAHYLAPGNALAALMRKQLKTRQPPPKTIHCRDTKVLLIIYNIFLGDIYRSYLIQCNVGMF